MDACEWRCAPGIGVRMDYVAVGLGGAVGAMLRYFLGAVIPKLDGGFPLSTLLINVAGCFLLGFLAAAFARNGLAGTRVALFCQVGLCGGFTTFSTFSSETFQLLQSGKAPLAVAYVVLSLGLGVLAVCAATTLATRP